MKKTDSTPEIEDIKTILEQLQSMQVPPKQSGAFDTHDSIADTEQDPVLRASKDTNNSIFFMLIFSVIIVFGAGAYIMWPQLNQKPQHKEKTSTPLPQIIDTIDKAAKRTDDKTTIEIAESEALMSEGKVLEARNLLIKLAEKEAALNSIAFSKIAFSLGQSFDPFFLMKLKSSDAEADVSEAKRWYNKWFETAQKNGLVKDNSKLQEILKKLN